MRSWYHRTVAPLCMLAALLVLSGAALKNAHWGPGGQSGDYVLRVTMRHYGVDARELERTIAIPLEDVLGALPGSKNMLTTVEYATVRVSVRFDKKDAGEALYALASDAVYRLYNALPRSVQRPEIDTASEADAPVWMAALKPWSKDAGTIIEKKIKPGFSRIEGAGSVEVYGLEVTETVVTADRERLAVSPLGIEALGNFLASDDVVKSAGYIVAGSRKIPVIVDGRYKTLAEMDNALFYFSESPLLQLGIVARTEMRTRKPDSISRVNGVKCPVIAVREGNGANLFALSAALSREAEFWKEQGVEMTILSDTGAELKEAFMNLLQSVLQSIAVLAVAGFFLVFSQRQAHSLSIKLKLSTVGMASVPVVLVISIGILVVLGVSIDVFALTGLAIGMGAAIDTCLLLLEELGTSGAEDEALSRVREIAPSLAGGVGTTVLALVPLAMSDYFGREVMHLAAGIAVANVAALGMSLVFLPPFVRHIIFGTLRGSSLHTVCSQTEVCHNTEDASRRETSSYNRKKSTLHMALRSMVCLVARFGSRAKGLGFVFFWLALTGGGIGALLLLTPDPVAPTLDSSIVFHVEMESGTSILASDGILEKLAGTIQVEPGVLNVQTSAYRGYGTVAVQFDNKTTSRDELAAQITAISVPGGFIWTDEKLEGRRAWQIHVLGDEGAHCEKYAKELAESSSSLPFVQETVLNYKEGAPDLVLVPRREKLAERGIDFFALGRALRFSLYGPVVYKRIAGGKEYDTRFLVRSNGEPLRQDITDTLLGDGTSKVGDLAVMEEVTDTSRIYRRDKRREATITITTAVMDPFKVATHIDELAKNLTLPPLYEVQFDKDTLQEAQRMRMSFIPFALAALGIVLALAVLAESFVDAFLVLMTVPPSLAVPLLLLLITGKTLRPAMICSFVAVSGIVVNAAVLLFDTAKQYLRATPEKPLRFLVLKTLKRRAASLIATCGTTVAGTIPILLMRGAEHEVVRSLAFVTFWGVFASGFLAVIFLPFMLRVHLVVHKDKYANRVLHEPVKGDPMNTS